MPLSNALKRRLQNLKSHKSQENKEYCDDVDQAVQSLANGKKPTTDQMCTYSAGDHLLTMAMLTNDKSLTNKVEAQFFDFKSNKKEDRDDAIVNSMSKKQVKPFYRYLGLDNPELLNKSGGRLFCNMVMKEIGHPMLKGWKIVRFLGGGLYGKAFLIMNPQVGTRVIKIARDTDESYLSIADEVRIQREFHACVDVNGRPNPIAPEVYGTYTKLIHGQKVSVIVMGAIDCTLQEMLCLVQKKNRSDRVKMVYHLVVLLMRIILTQKRANLTHGDMHDQNIGLYTDPKTNKTSMLLIDFGQASTKTFYPHVDFEQLLRLLVRDNYTYSYLFAKEFQRFLDTMGSSYQLKGTKAAWLRLKDIYDPHVGLARRRNKSPSPKPCRRGWVRNETTKRCRKMQGGHGYKHHEEHELWGGENLRHIDFVSGPQSDAPKRKRKFIDCKAGWTRNPRTRRCRKMDAGETYTDKFGVVVVAEGATRRRRKTCPQGSVFNTTTQRCINTKAVRRKLKACPNGSHRYKPTMRCRKHVPDVNDRYEEEYARMPPYVPPPANQNALPANQNALPANQNALPANQNALPANQNGNWDGLNLDDLPMEPPANLLGDDGALPANQNGNWDGLNLDDLPLGEDDALLPPELGLGLDDGMASRVSIR